MRNQYYRVTLMSDKKYIVNGTVMTKAYDDGEDFFEVPGGVRAIGKGAFRETNFKRVVLPKSVVKIETNAFKGCKNLEEINLKYIYEFGNGAFAGCGPVYVYSKTSAENYWGTAIHINKAFVEILNENDDTHEEFFFYPEIFQSIRGCFQNGKFDIAAFDRAVFHLKDISPDEIRNRMYAMLVRLPGIYKLHNSEFYVCYSAFIDYFKAHKPRSAMAVLDFDKERFLGFLELAIDENTFPELLDYSIKKGDPEVTAAVLKYKNEHFPNLTDNFDLE